MAISQDNANKPVPEYNHSYWNKDRIMEIVVTTGYKTCNCKAPVKSSPPTIKPTPNFLTGRMPFRSPNQQCRSTAQRNYTTFHRLAHPSSSGIFRRIDHETLVFTVRKGYQKAFHQPSDVSIASLLSVCRTYYYYYYYFSAQGIYDTEGEETRNQLRKCKRWNDRQPRWSVDSKLSLNR